MKDEFIELLETAGNIVAVIAILFGSAVALGLFLGIAGRVAGWIV